MYKKIKIKILNYMQEYSCEYLRDLKRKQLHSC